MLTFLAIILPLASGIYIERHIYRAMMRINGRINQANEQYFSQPPHQVAVNRSRYYSFRRRMKVLRFRRNSMILMMILFGGATFGMTMALTAEYFGWMA